MKIYDYKGRKNICGDRVREARQKKRLTQEALAAKLQIEGVTIERDSLLRIEIGTRFVTDYELKVIAKVLGVSPLWLIDDENELSGGKFPPLLLFFAIIFLKAIDFIRQMPYNKITGKGKPSKAKGEDNTTGKGVRRLTEEQIKELLELLKKALESETVERITISIKPNKKNKQS